ncbi:autotransporter-associated beta strand repeat-containing protein [Candidatus Odyssella thessalonicensis]|uniref:autotransporter-associated beta strand repeat-containing protein n=1 Tax=Candidatus Odyssella thessalonicensis TaxID=84647 RepID=UPI0002F41E47|nr:autotransporter-associated beta strand repeat-containing protein [Candidatus Odyssella thessalonicensis]
MTFAAGIAVDTSGNVYVTDRANNNVYKLTPSGATYTQSTLLTGFNDPKSIAVDNSGNLYITDSGNGNVVKATLSGGTYSRSNIITGIGGLNGVACNSTGSTVYVTKNGSGAGVIRGVLSGGVYGTTTIASAGLNNPMEVTADSSNNVYVADFYGNKIFKETYNAGSYSQSQIDSGGLNAPYGAVVDSAGIVYFSQGNTASILALTPAGGGTYTQSTFAGISNPWGLAMDSSGSLYVARQSNNVTRIDINRLNITQPTTSGGTVTLSNNSTYTQIDGVANSQISIGSYQLTANISSSAPSTFNGNITGTGPLIVSGTGTFTLTGTNTYSGTTTISSGTLQIGDGTTTGSITSNVTNNSSLLFNLGSSNSTYGGVISGTGSVTKQGAGTLIVTGAHTYSGGTTITAGALQIGNGGTTGSLSGNITNNAALIFNRSDAITFAGIISGSGSLDKQGASTLTLTGANTYIGGTTITAGTLQVGNGGTIGSITSNITNNGALIFNRSDAVTYAGTIAGTGTLDKQGAGTLTLTGDSTYTGNTTITAGVLQIGNNGTTGSLVSDITNNGTLIFNRSNASTYTGNLSGSGALSKQGTGILTLTGTNTHSGGTTITAGTLQVGNGGTIGSMTGNITNNGALIFNRSDAVTYAGTIAGTGTLDKQGAGTLTVTGAHTYSGGTTITAGVLQIGNGGTTGSISGNITNNGSLIFNRSDAITYSTIISGTGTVNKQGTATLTLTGNNTYTGGTTITAGTLQLGNGGTIGSITGNITNNGALIFNRSDAVTYAGTLTGTGSLTKQGASSLTLSAANTYSGGTTITNGTVSIRHHQSLGTGAITFAGTGTTLEIGTALSGPIANAITVNANSNLDTQGYDVTLSGTLTGTSTLRKLGTGILTLASANAFNGVILDLDTVAIGDNQALGSGTFTFNNAGTKLIIASNLNNVANPLALTANGIIDTNGNTATLTGALTGTGDLTKDGPGTLQITTANPGYSGDVVANAGELKVNGSLPNSNITVANVARFTGNATINSLVNSGIVKPGNSIGTVQVLANFDNTNGTYNCEINDASQSDLIQVTGTATLGGTLNILSQPGDYRTPKTYTILTAGNPIVTQFTTVTSSSALLSYTLNYLANSVQLTAFQATLLSDVIGIGNAGEVADYIIRHNPPPGSQLGQLLAVLATLPLNELYEALNQMQPSANVLIGATIGKYELGQADELFSSFTMEETLKRLRNLKKKNTASQTGLGIAAALTEDLSLSLNYNNEWSSSERLNRLLLEFNYRF